MSAFDYSARTIDGEDKSLKDYDGKVLLVVNVASHCGFTGQYDGLEKLYQKYRDRGLVVLGFPCNQFGGQESADEQEIKSFCRLTYNVTFPMFSKIDVNGSNAHPLFKFLKSAQPGLMGIQRIAWNFTKFLVDRNGNVVKRFATIVTPASMTKSVEALLTKG